MKIIEILDINNKKYPEKLRKIPNPPIKLYCEGNIELLKNNIISIVGSRKCTENGIKLTKYFAENLAKQNITIASGMAVGIDTVAHLQTLHANGKTIAVLPSGLEHIYPKTNTNLFKQIIKNDGLVISEYSPKIKAKSEYFLERNRIVSGISIGVLVVEGVYRSGTSVTAKLAKLQNKKVFAIPHEIWDSHGVGPNNLIRDGAILVTSPENIIEEFDFLEYSEYKNVSIDSIEKEISKKELKNKKYENIYKLINEKPISINEIYIKSPESIEKINNILFMLEIEGYIKKEAGGYVCITTDK